MGWTESASKARIKKEADGLGEIEVKKLVREMELENLSVTKCREIFGAHLYIPVTNFSKLVQDEDYAKEEYKRLIQCIHCYQRELSRITETDFSDFKVHFQGTKLHALCYRPVDNNEKISSHVVLLALVVQDFVKNVFNPFFDGLTDFEVAAGAAMGDVIATKNGATGDRELLFLGAPANYAAKIVGEAGIRLTSTVYDALPASLQEHCRKIDATMYRISMSYEDLGEHLDEIEVDWTRELSERRLKKDKEALPLRDIQVSGADELIDTKKLSARNNKKVAASSVYADVIGFTAHIDAQESDEDKEQAVRTFHLIRKEMRSVMKRDYPGLRIQYQGDRIQGLFHLPKEDATKICDTAVRAACALQSSMEKTLKSELPDAKNLHLAIGIDMGTTLVSSLGERGQRDTICIGDAVEQAAVFEERLGSEEIGISGTVRENLTENIQALFVWDNAKKCYVAGGLTLDKLEKAESEGAQSKSVSIFTRGSRDIRESPPFA